tara:strand:- start:31923 stop:32252 length:330 start_codon:yes stop_codon:yes gene_type:complete
MAQMLNLDEVSAKEERLLKFKGVEYPMATMSVHNFIEMTRRGEALDESSAKGTTKVTDQLAWMIEMVKTLFPTMPDDILNAFNMVELNLILEFSRSQVDEEAEEVKKES